MMGNNIVRITCIIFSLTALRLHFTAHAIDIVVGRNGTCENESCITFQELLHNKYFASDSHIWFSPGNYSVEHKVQVIAKDIHNLSLISTSSSHNQLQSATLINCNENLSFVFLNVTNLQILGLNFVKCGLQVPVHVIPSVVLAYYGELSPLYAAVFLAYVKNLTVANVSIVYSQGYGILALNVHSNSTIQNLQLLGDTQQASSTLRKPIAIYQNQYLVNCFFGNAWFIFDDSSVHPVKVLRMHISGVQITWVDSYYECVDTFHSNVQTGLGFKFLQKNYPIELDMSYIDFVSGSLDIEVHATANNTMISILNSTILTTASYSFGSSILTSDKLTNQHLPSQHVFKLTNCQFKGTSATLHELRFTFLDEIINLKSAQSISIIVKNTSFFSSSLHLSTPSTCESKLNGSLLIIQSKFISVQSMMPSIMVPSIELNFGNYTNPCFFLVSVKSCQFIENYRALSAGSTSVTTLEMSDTTIQKGGGVILTTMKYVFLENTIFQNCKDESITALTLLGTTVNFKGGVIFSNNRGRYGGAIALEPWRVFHTEMVKESFLYFHPHTHLYLLNNTALNLGGGIYVKEFLLDKKHQCFYQVTEWNGMELDQLDIKIVFDSNTAEVAGDSIFGGLDKRCLLTGYASAGELNAFDILFEIQNSMSSSELAAPVQQIRVCNPTAMTPACKTYREYVYAAYPGQMFEFSAVALGSLTNFYFQKGALPEAVYSSFDSNFSAQLGPQQEVQRLPKSCGNLTFTVFSAQKVVYLNSFIKTKAINKNLDSISLHIQLLDCPLGFQLGGDPPRCECIKLLTDNNCKCIVSRTLTYNCPEGFWLGNTADSTLIHRHCPFHYCASVDPVSAEDACAANRTGILCGGCKPGYSLALGTSHCLPHCSHTYILLIIPIALAGLLLVAFLLICNLTVSTGTINGLIYFANIVGFNNKLFFPKSENSFLSVFISWLNLDLGIETCFYRGMDMYAKTWLQFLFPFYIWAIVFVIIISSHYSVLVTKLTRSNAVPVLATLLRLSYAKLLRTIITILSFTYLESSNGTKISVWLYDGNILFSSGRHLTLLLFAILTLLLLVFPYTILLLLSPFLQAKASHRRLQLVNKMKPFLDAYHGPYRDRFRNWTGVMLLVQMLQFLAFACNSLGDPNINLLVIAITSAGLLTLSWNLGSIYNRRILNTLESLFILALTVLAVASLYIGAVSDQVTQDRNQRMVTFIIVSASFVVFSMILMYHTIVLTQSLLSSLANTRRKNDCGNDIELDTLTQSGYIQPQRPPSCSSVELREPLLDLQS